MLAKLKPQDTQNLKVVAENVPVAHGYVADEPSIAELRRQMYERIARGNALAEAENNARRMWRSD